jgi:hypothetical protein
MDDRVFFNPRKNHAFSYCDTILLLAYREKRPAGRIMGIINHKYNDPNNLKEGRFCFLETPDDFEIAETLIRTIEQWAKEHRMTSLVGPLGFSDKDPQGFLIEGFDEPVSLSTNCNFPYMVEFAEKLGYVKKVDLFVYKLIIPDEIPEFFQRIKDRISINNNNLNMIHFNSRKAMKPYVRPVFELVNETFKDIYAFAPLSEKEMKEFADRFLILMDPRFLKVVENEKKEVIAFILGMSDISVGLKKCRGRLIPFGIFQVLLAQKRTRQLNLLLGGIKPQYRNIGVDSLLGVSMIKEAHKAGMKVVDSHLELENNTRMRAEMEKLGGIVYKKFRIFQRELNTAAETVQTAKTGMQSL